MNRRHWDNDRSVLLALLGIGVLAAVSIVFLVLTNGDPPKKISQDQLVTSAAPVPSSGASRSQLVAQCQQVQTILSKVAKFTLEGPASVPAGAPKPVGQEVTSCALSAKTDTSSGHFVASRFTGTTAAAEGAAIDSAGWSKQHVETHSGLTETLYTLSGGSAQIVVVDLGNNGVIVLYTA